MIPKGSEGGQNLITARRATPWVVAAIMACGVVCVGLRLYSRYGLHMIQGDSVWRLTYDVTFEAAKSGIRLHAAIPSDQRHGRVFRRELRYSGLTTERLRPARNGTREVTVATQRSGEFRLTARFDIHLSPRTTFRIPAAEAPLTVEERAQYADHPGGQHRGAGVGVRATAVDAGANNAEDRRAQRRRTSALNAAGSCCSPGHTVMVQPRGDSRAKPGTRPFASRWRLA